MCVCVCVCVCVCACVCERAPERQPGAARVIGREQIGMRVAGPEGRVGCHFGTPIQRYPHLTLPHLYVNPKPVSLNPPPYTLHPTPYTLARAVRQRQRNEGTITWCAAWVGMSATACALRAEDNGWVLRACGCLRGDACGERAYCAVAQDSL